MKVEFAAVTLVYIWHRESFLHIASQDEANQHPVIIKKKEICIACLINNYVSFYVLQALQAGTVWINCSQPCFDQTAWGGNKRSGIGRELGEWYDKDYHF